MGASASRHLRLSEPLLAKSKALANAALRMVADSDPRRSVPGFADARRTERQPESSALCDVGASALRRPVVSAGDSEFVG